MYTLPSIKPEASSGEPQGLTVGHGADSLAQLGEAAPPSHALKQTQRPWG